MAVIVVDNSESWFYGTADIDTFIIQGTRSQYSVQDIGGANPLAYVVGPNATCYLSDGEFLRFDDQIVPLTCWSDSQAVVNGTVKHDYDAYHDLFRTTYSYNDGSSVKYDYDALWQFVWDTIKTTYDTNGHRTQVDYTNDNGSKSVYQYDANNAFNWDQIQTQFDVNGQRTQVNYTYDDGTKTTYQYDVGNAFNWDQIQTKFNVDGLREQVSYTYDDGTTTVYQYDIGNKFSWSQVQTNTNADGQTVKTVYTNDDGTSVLYQYDVNGVYSWSKQARYFDADGHKTKDIFDNDNGTHTLIEYDINGIVINTKSYGGAPVAAAQSESTVGGSDAPLAAATSVSEQQAHTADADQTSQASGDSFVFRTDAQSVHQAANFIASAATNSAALADLVSESHSAISQLLAHLVSHDDGHHNELHSAPSLVPHDADMASFHLADLVARGFFTH